MTFLYNQRNNFLVYSLDPNLGRKQSYQRFEQCIFTLKKKIRPAMEALFASKYFDPIAQQAAKEMTQEAVNDILKDLRINTILSKTLGNDLIERLQNITLIIGYCDEVLNISLIDEIYEELGLRGNESFVITELHLKKHNRKMISEKRTSLIRRLDTLSKEYKVALYIDENILCT